jgi:hypothetical protein
MRKARVFGQLLGVQGMVIEEVTVEVDPDGDGEVLVVSAAAGRGHRKLPVVHRDAPVRGANGDADTPRPPDTSIEWGDDAGGRPLVYRIGGRVSDAALDGSWMTPPPAVRAFRAGFSD